MIENQHQLQAARSWLRYWKSVAADGEQSWLGAEDARAEIMRYAREITDYERRVAGRRGGGEVDGDDGSPGSSVPQNSDAAGWEPAERRA